MIIHICCCCKRCSYPAIVQDKQDELPHTFTYPVWRSRFIQQFMTLPISAKWSLRSSAVASSWTPVTKSTHPSTAAAQLQILWHARFRRPCKRSQFKSSVHICLALPAPEMATTRMAHTSWVLGLTFLGWGAIFMIQAFEVAHHAFIASSTALCIEHTFVIIIIHNWLRHPFAGFQSTLLFFHARTRSYTWMYRVKRVILVSWTSSRLDSLHHLVSS